MAQSYLDKVADELADLALADQAASGDDSIIDVLGTVLGASSQTLQEAFLTAVRVRRAETRARELLAQRAASGYVDGPKPPPAPLQGVVEPEEEPAAGGPQVEQPSEQEDTPPEAPTPTVGMPRRVTR